MEGGVFDVYSDESDEDTDAQFVIRHNPASDECVLYISRDSGKPTDYGDSARGGKRVRVVERPAIDARCPFCPGNEHKCAPTVAQLVAPDGVWLARCIPNRFPILHKLGTGRINDDHEIRAAGRMEVLVADRRHNVCLAQQQPEFVGQLMCLWRERYSRLWRHRATRYVTMFANHGARAGGSLQHAHFQVVALQFVPPAVMRLVRAQASHHHCSICDAIRRAMAQQRVIFKDERVVAFTETATHSGTVWLVPLRCTPTVAEADDGELQAMGAALAFVARAAYIAYDDPDFNLAFYSAPKNTASSFHWYGVYVPHLVEDCSLARIQYGMAATSVLPELAAQTLRDAAAAVATNQTPKPRL